MDKVATSLIPIRCLCIGRYASSVSCELLTRQLGSHGLFALPSRPYVHLVEMRQCQTQDVLLLMPRRLIFDKGWVGSSIPHWLWWRVGNLGN